LSPLTKTFAVLVTVLSILLLALVVPFVYNTNNYKAQVQSAQHQVLAAQANAQMAQQENNALRAARNQQDAATSSKISEQTATITDLRQKLQDAQAQARAAKGRVAALEASYTQLAAAERQNAQLLTQVTNDLKTSQSKVVNQSRQMIDLSNRNEELQATLDSLNRQVRRFAENLHQAQQQVQQYKARIARLPANVKQQVAGGNQAEQIVSYAPTPIAGKITGIDHPSKSLTLAEVNVGRNDNVKKNMRFMVYRQNKFLGFLVIQQVDSNASVGRVEAVRGPLKSGDQVLVPAHPS